MKVKEYWRGVFDNKGLNATSISGYLHSIVAEFTGADMGRADFALATAIIVVKEKKKTRKSKG